MLMLTSVLDELGGQRRGEYMHVHVRIMTQNNGVYMAQYNYVCTCTYGVCAFCVTSDICELSNFPSPPSLTPKLHLQSYMYNVH